MFGALGVAGYLGYLSHQVFEDSLLFPVILSGIGLLIIYLGVLWQRHENNISQRLRDKLPLALQQLLAQR